MMAERHRKRRHAAEAVFSQGAMIAHRIRGDLLAGLCRLHHRLHEIVVGIAFIGEAPAVAHHGDDAGLGAVDEVRHHALAAVLAFGDRDRHPGRGVRQRVLDPSARGLRQSQAVAGVADRAGRKMLGAVGACGNIALRLATSCGKPPQASTTPRLALTRISLPWRSTIAPRTAPSSTISSCTGDDSHSGIFRSNADLASRPASALPLVNVMPRPWRITSMACFDSRLAT